VRCETSPANTSKEPAKRIKVASANRIIAGVILLILLASLYLTLWYTGLLATLMNKQGLQAHADMLGAWVVILAMMTAIVISPIPSGPIAMAAGAAYGPIWGASYVIIGAEAGAIIAFLVGRLLGYEALSRWTEGRNLLERLSGERSQNWLMLVVFGSRLVPFISFDLVSYAAGVTPLALWRFALATLAGVVPASVLLAYFGEAIMIADPAYQTAAIILVGTVTLAPILGRLLWQRYRRSSS